MKGWMYTIRVSLSSNKQNKSLWLGFSLCVSAVLENLIISSCNYKHLYFRISLNPNFSLYFSVYTSVYMFLSIVLTCIKFSFLEENSLVCRDVWEAFSTQAVPCWSSSCSHPSYKVSMSSFCWMPCCFSLHKS